MNIYVVLHNSNAAILEKFTEEKWEDSKTKINPNKILLATPNAMDEELLSFKFKEIVWDRLYNPLAKNYEKIVIPFEPTNVEKMERRGKEELSEKIKILNGKLEYEKELQKSKNSKAYHERINAIALHLMEQDQLDKAFEETHTEEEIIKKWMGMGMKAPPHVLIDIKEKSNMSWTKFKKYCIDKYGVDFLNIQEN